MSALSLAQAETELSSIKEDLKMAEIGLESMHKLTTNILIMSDIENERLTAKPATLNLIDLIAKISATLRPEAKKKQITLETSVSPDVVVVVVDPKLTEKFLTELLQNGINYGTRNTTIHVDITKKDDTVLFEIKNQGEPISQEELSRVFTKYYRGSNKPSDVSGGGLGLYLAREYVKLLGGKIWFSSAKKETIFWITLPLR
jgi:hypothetical protein